MLWRMHAVNLSRSLQNQISLIRLLSAALKPRLLHHSNSPLLALPHPALLEVTMHLQRQEMAVRKPNSCRPSVSPRPPPGWTPWMPLPTCQRACAFSCRLPGLRTCPAPTPWSTIRSLPASCYHFHSAPCDSSLHLLTPAISAAL